MNQNQDQDKAASKPVTDACDNAAADSGKDALLQKVCAQLDADSHALDGETLARLNQGRLAAMAQLEESGGLFRRWYWAAGSVAASLLLVIVALQYAPVEPSLQPDSGLAATGDTVIDKTTMEKAIEAEPAAGLDELQEVKDLEALAMLAEDEALDFYAELGFLEWLDQQEDAASLLDPERETSGLVNFRAELG